VDQSKDSRLAGMDYSRWNVRSRPDNQLVSAAR
jgi:hypothetical protein